MAIDWDKNGNTAKERGQLSKLNVSIRVHSCSRFHADYKWICYSPIFDGLLNS